MTAQQPDWVNYWNNVAPRIEAYIDARSLPLVDSYLTQCYGYFCFVTENVESKVTKHKNLVRTVFPMLVQIQDMLRANILNQAHLLLTPAALNLRVAFEIKVTLKYIYSHSDPAMMLQRLANFIVFETLVGRISAPSLPNPSDEEIKEFEEKHPYWTKKGSLDHLAKWNGEGKSIKKICDGLDMSSQYYQIYSLTSRFVHGSPVVRQFYSSGGSISPIPEKERVASFTLMASKEMIEVLEEFMIFFGVSHNQVDISLLKHAFNEGYSSFGEVV
ncbi:DUF5677 domain-containing protein [Bdellovibrio sp. HCB209]|uniref:DUF5677 domain-containing protein n=1 Tax=Bdellovibrio sp. HCB209 TaxID=3394354 RepID=UPI0039B3EF5E